jgi:hypothetical protein
MFLMMPQFPLLFYSLDKDLWSSIKSFLIFLNRFPEYPKTQVHDIEVDQECLSQLQKI